MRRLSGKGVTLEPQLAVHAAELFALLSDPALYPYLDTPPPVDEPTLRARLLRLEARQSPDGSEDWLNWIVRVSDGALAGYVQATVQRGGRADVAFVIGTAHQRRGIAFAATSAMLIELAEHYGVTRCRATADPANAASIGLLGRLGFHRVDDAEALPDLCFELDLPGAAR